MPNMDDIYGVAPSDWPAPVPPTITSKADALAIFTTGIGSALKADALDVIAVKVRAVETIDQATKLADQRARVKLLLKDIEERRKNVVEPIKREAAAVDAEAKHWSDPLKQWDHDAERVLLAWQRAEGDKKRREEEARQRALIEASERQRIAEEAGKTAEAEEASREIMRVEAAPEPRPVTGFRTDAGTTSLRKTWRVEVIDASLVPDVYLVPDLPKLQAAVKAGAREISGCHIYEDESLTVRTRG